ncbi:hypothetical protein EU546_01935 [Candidatus Thorarchaeota archaeon]|nr:MAG: hypothetical protein EU546_01935 [Candidatus Thorarchaeota archaeon]
MKQLGAFTLDLGKNREMPVEVLVDSENTILVIDCNCCREFVSSRLPGGALIPIASALKDFFGRRGMRNTSVDVNGVVMRRTYKGLLDEAEIPSMTQDLESAVKNFTRKRKSK